MTGIPKRQENGETPPDVSRRGFLKIAAVGIGGAPLLATGPATSLLAGNSRPSYGIINPNRSDFTLRLGEVFKVRKSPLEEVGIELAEVAGISSSMPSYAEESFSAVFRGPQDRPLEQDTYAVEHATMGAFPLFIVPVYSDGEGLYYQAIFNRL